MGKRSASLHNLLSPEPDKADNNEKNVWVDVCGVKLSNSPVFMKSKSVENVYDSKSQFKSDFNTTTITRRSIKNNNLKGKPLKPKQLLPSIHEKHNSFHGNKSPVLKLKKTRPGAKRVPIPDPVASICTSLFQGMHFHSDKTKQITTPMFVQVFSINCLLIIHYLCVL